MKLVFFQSRNVLSRLIRWWTRGAWSHVGVLDERDEVIFESFAGKGVVAVDAKRRLAGACFALYEPVRDLTEAERDALRRWLRKQLGKGYDYRGLARFVTRRVRGDDERLFCSEYVAEAFGRIGRPLSRAHPWLISPEELSRSTEIRPIPKGGWNRPEHAPVRLF